MKVLDLDMDYFMKHVVRGIPETETTRLPDEDFGKYVWEENEVRSFLENNLGLKKERKLKGRIVKGHNESLLFWKELIKHGRLVTPFEVVHVDSHADLGLGDSSWVHIMKCLLKYPVAERPYHSSYIDCYGNIAREGIGNYLLFAVAYQWVSRIIYCGNPCDDCNDYWLHTLKDFKEEIILDKPVENTIS